MMSDETWMDDTRSGADEHFGWRTFRLPPVPALIAGTAYGAVVGAVIAWDLAVLIRLGRLVSRRVSSEIARRRGTASGETD